MGSKDLSYYGKAADGDVPVFDGATRKWHPEQPVAGDPGANGAVLAAQPDAYAGTSPNAETGSGDYVVTVIPNHSDSEGRHYAFGFQREGDAFPFLAVTDVGDWVISDGSYEPTNGPGGGAWPVGSQWTPQGLKLAGGGSASLDIKATSFYFSGDVIMSSLPTSDPAVAGQLWNDAGTVKVSAG